MYAEKYGNRNQGEDGTWSTKFIIDIHIARVADATKTL